MRIGLQLSKNFNEDLKAKNTFNIKVLKNKIELLIRWKHGIERLLKQIIPSGTYLEDKICSRCADIEGLIYEEGCSKCTVVEILNAVEI